MPPGPQPIRLATESVGVPKFSGSLGFWGSRIRCPLSRRTAGHRAVAQSGAHEAQVHSTTEGAAARVLIQGQVPANRAVGNAKGRHWAATKVLVIDSAAMDRSIKGLGLFGQIAADRAV
jgi:hypothetical protein